MFVFLVVMMMMMMEEDMEAPRPTLHLRRGVDLIYLICTRDDQTEDIFQSQLYDVWASTTAERGGGNGRLEHAFRQVYDNTRTWPDARLLLVFTAWTRKGQLRSLYGVAQVINHPQRHCIGPWSDAHGWGDVFPVKWLVACKYPLPLLPAALRKQRDATLIEYNVAVECILLASRSPSLQWPMFSPETESAQLIFHQEKQCHIRDMDLVDRQSNGIAKLHETNKQRRWIDEHDQREKRRKMLEKMGTATPEDIAATLAMEEDERNCEEGRGGEDDAMDAAIRADEEAFPTTAPPLDPSRRTLSSFRQPEPPPGFPDRTKDAFSACIYDVDYTHVRGVPDSNGLDDILGKRVPVIRCFGTTTEGYSVAILVHSFYPYFYARAPPDFLASITYPQPMSRELDERKLTRAELMRLVETDARYQKEICTCPTARMLCKAFCIALCNELKGMLYKYEHSNEDQGFTQPHDLIIRTELVRKRNLTGNYTEKTEWMLKITLLSPTLVTRVRDLLWGGTFQWGKEMLKDKCVPFQYDCFEANVPFYLRFMIDKKLYGCSWITLPANSYHKALVNHTHADVELHTRPDTLVVHAPNDPQWRHVAPMRKLTCVLTSL